MRITLNYVCKGKNTVEIKPQYGRPEKCCYTQPKHMGVCGRGHVDRVRDVAPTGRKPE